MEENKKNENALPEEKVKSDENVTPEKDVESEENAEIKADVKKEEKTEKKKKAKKKGLTSTILLIVIFLVGLCILLYPSVSNFWNEKRQSQAIMNYNDLIADFTPEDFQAHFEKAEEYNRKLRLISEPFLGYSEISDEYYSVLDINGNGMMGYITIDKIKVQIPIYHGTSDNVLNSAVGHLEGSSLPIGGENTHTVLSAHRGLPSAKLFTNLDELVVGDIFTLTILDRTLTYQVDQVIVVLPEEVNELYVENGEDYCTLVTCTPYGINTHRLLVRGTRIENIEEGKKVNVITDAYQVDPLIVTPAVAIPMLGGLLIFLIVKSSKEKKKNQSLQKEKKKNENK
ncbi:MAG: class C sortase [Ruminococcaceae bacterium]|nr:class C sortase [Oscillospiraceae bacterium]